MNKLLTISLVTLWVGMVACREEVVTEIVEVPVETAWKNDPRFYHKTKIKLNSRVVGNRFCTYGPNVFTVIDTTDRDTLRHYITRLNYPGLHPLPISEVLFVEAEYPYVRLANIERPVSRGADVWIDARSLDTTLYAINVRGDQFSSIGANAIGQCLVQFVAEQELPVYLFSTKKDSDGIGLMVTDTTQVVLENLIEFGTGLIIFAKGIKDYFIISVSGGTYKIYSDGTSRQVIDQELLNLFEHQGTLYGLRDSDNQPIFVSEDDGESWQSYADFPRTFVLSHYSHVGDSLIAFRHSSLYTLRFDGMQYHGRELVSEGLEGHEITSVTGYGDRVYVTTYSGVFYRSIDNFFEPVPVKVNE